VSARTKDLFGTAAGEASATPDSYGIAPSGFRLPAPTRLGLVRLQVADLARSLAYYRRVLGLRIIEERSDRALLGAQDDPEALIELHAVAGSRPAARRNRLGLYHFALLLPDRASLARFVRHLEDLREPVGAGDHLVSEALYLHDPDDLGIEVYADRPRDTWRRAGRELLLATDPMDLAAIAASADATPWTGLPAGTRMGHVHLHVGDIASAAAFYGEGLGFDQITWRYPGALFLGAGGYHHHVGTNIWAGPTARPSTSSDAGLLEWTMVLPDAASIAAVAASVAKSGAVVDVLGDDDIRTRDPWGTAVRVVTPTALARSLSA
jgi:catechol 2,3-dioxygenase